MLDRENGSKEYVPDPDSYYPWFGIGDEEVVLDFEGTASGNIVVDMTGGWFADKRLGIHKGETSNAAGYIDGLAWGMPTRVKFVRNGVVYEGKIDEVNIKPRDVRSFGFDCKSRGHTGAAYGSLVQVTAISGAGDLPVKEYRGGRQVALVHQSEIVGVKAEYVNSDKCVFDGQGVHTITIER